MVKRSSGELLFGLRVDRALPVSVTTQLYGAIRDLIAEGALSPGRRLPSSRTLATELGVSRTTAIAVYERLLSEGLIEARTGSGSYVSDQAASQRPQASLRAAESGDASDTEPAGASVSQAILAASGRFVPRLPHPQKPRAFVTGMPDYDSFPLAIWARLTARHWRGTREVVLGYGDPEGDARLRRAIAGHLRANRGISCDEDQIFITAGAQQAFDLIGRVLLNPGDKVWFEDPGAIGARNSLTATGARLVPVPVDGEGLNVAQALARAPDFRLAFVTPSHQHPTGAEMSLARREALLAAAGQAGAWIIEDDYDGEFRYDGRPLPTLVSGDRAGRVIYVGTFSKSLFPALRLGFYIAPRPLVPVFAAISRAFLQGVSTEVQAVLAAFIEEGHFATHLRRMREIYALRHAAFHRAAAEHLTGLLDCSRSQAGFHILGRFADTRLRETEVLKAARAAGLVVSGLGSFSSAGPDPQNGGGLVLGVTAIPPAAIERGVADLARVLRSCLQP
ncbi:PLP-dependent aminotransferase family protein [Pseudogemmobacter faecipullorum]|uniref:PLP-dependent aminotransferase family protein n=1 Tax=Pseudogemmobacter faecipullorum TaxID=2755041 RepID=A0ABS8CI73_9RHOB|nr:PLP-dependent aminotransferase family protein [Pseudogemmobacter faecipullorum]MCB5409079.1 PLP-dependent aminotransferase family protein [Pseudogemmobacter faecipullorum]